MGTQPCPMCGRTAQIARDGTRSSFHIQCDRCGRFEMSDVLLTTIQTGLPAPDSPLLPYLSAYTRQASVSGARALLTTENWRDLARSHKAISISQKIVRLLELLASRSTHPGAAAYFDPDLDPPLLDSASSQEVEFLLEHLVKLGYIDRTPDYNIAGLSGFCMTVKGWERLEPPRGRGIPGRCFIAMSFDPSLNEAFLLGIEPAVRECEFRPIRIDREHHNEKICDKILAEIRLAEFMVADFTLQRAGVYFEAGFAMGLGRPVIWMCREDDFENIHFDTRQYNHIPWSTATDLRAKLIDRIRATINASTDSNLP